MATATALQQRAPSREDFAALLEESFGRTEIQEGSVVKGLVVAIEKDVAVIDVGAKTEGRVALKEFMGPGRGDTPIKVGDEVEVYLERVESVIFNQVKGGYTVDLDGAVAFLPRSQVDIRPVRDVSPLMGNPQPFM